MHIPANNSHGVVLRTATNSPMFYFDHFGDLHMRYSARQRNISWKQDAFVDKALNEITWLLSDNQFVKTLRLKDGMGILSRNVLHRREAFTDSQRRHRLIYRARYTDSIQSNLVENLHAVA